jgi:hypothetical protein
VTTRTARVAWALAGVSLALVVADAVVTAQYRSLLSEDTIAVHGFPFVDLAVLGCAVLGALILGRHDRHPIGLLFVVIGVTSALSLLTEAYSLWVVDENGPGSRGLGGVSGWVSSMVGGQLAISGLTLVFLLVPDGRLLSRRWLVAVVVTLLGLVSCVAGLLSEDPTRYDITSVADETPPLSVLLFSIGFLLISAGLLASVASMVVRFRRSTGEARQQMRLIAVGAGLVAVGLFMLFLVQQFNGGRQTWLASIPLFASYLVLPILFGIAVLRYRLYDVEVILNRTLVVVLGTTFAAIGYTTLVVLVGNRVGQGTGFWVSLLATALVAVAFQPLRRQVVRLANRLAYGSRAQPYEALADFSDRIAEAPSPETLLQHVADAAGDAVSAQGAAAVLSAPGARSLTAVRGTVGDDADSYDVPVHHEKQELGSIRVWLRSGTPRSSDVRLLEALADQSAVAFRNVGLQAQLAAHITELDETTEELARSRARIIEADDAARRTMEAAITRDVLPHLATVPDGITASRAAIAAGRSATGLSELVSATNTALEELRDLTRGLFPTQLARSGLEPALRSHLARSGLAGALYLDATVAGRRYPNQVEAAVYQCLVAAVRELDEVSTIDLVAEDHTLVVRLHGHRRDDADLQAVTDRAEAVGGSMTSAADQLHIRIPAGDELPSSD